MGSVDKLQGAQESKVDFKFHLCTCTFASEEGPYRFIRFLSRPVTTTTTTTEEVKLHYDGKD